MGVTITVVSLALHLFWITMVSSTKPLVVLILATFVHSENVTVRTNIGTVIGYVEDVSFDRIPLKVNTFLGIPFAEPPVGRLRFQKPVQKAAFTKPFIADTMSHRCIQNTEGRYNHVSDDLLSEDCLYLNVYVPGGDRSATKNLTVMVWIYGGGFQYGSQDVYSGKAFAALNNVILVTLNYRLSALGFLSTGDDEMAGNYGLWDQHLAIRWVNSNIRSFGGDPMSVTIFGQSAGAASVVYQALYEGNNRLFQRVISESGVANSPWALSEDPNSRFVDFANRTSCLKASQSDTIECLRGLPPGAFKNVTQGYLPVVDGDFVKLKPTDIISNKTILAWDILQFFGKFDLLIGVNSAEGAGLIESVQEKMKSRNEDYSNGYTQKMFENDVVGTIFDALYINKTYTVMKAIVNQYVDWTCPNDKLRMRDRAVEFLSDVTFFASVVKAANVHDSVNGSGKEFFYVYDHVFSKLDSPERWFKGANHGEELAMVFGFPQNLVNAFTPIKNFTSDAASQLPKEEVALSRKMMTYWTNFAKTG